MRRNIPAIAPTSAGSGHLVAQPGKYTVSRIFEPYDSIGGDQKLTEVKSALRFFLKNDADVVIADLMIFSGESIELAMVVTGVASYGAPVPANCNSAPIAAVQSTQYPGIRLVT